MSKQVIIRILIIIILITGVVGFVLFSDKSSEVENDIIAKDLEICNTLEDSYAYKTSKCYAEVAIKANNYSICEELADKDGLFAPGWVPDCFTFIAIEKNEKEICDLIDKVSYYRYPNNREQCYGFVEKGEMGIWIVE